MHHTTIEISSDAEREFLVCKGKPVAYRSVASQDRRPRSVQKETGFLQESDGEIRLINSSDKSLGYYKDSKESEKSEENSHTDLQCGKKFIHLGVVGEGSFVVNELGPGVNGPLVGSSLLERLLFYDCFF